MKGSDMKDHEIAQLVSELTQVAKDYGQTQQLRARISEIVVKAVTPPPLPDPECTICGTKIDLFKDGWYGYRCKSTNCMVL